MDIIQIFQELNEEYVIKGTANGIAKCYGDYPHYGEGNTPDEALLNYIDLNEEEIKESYIEMMNETKEDDNR